MMLITLSKTPQRKCAFDLLDFFLMRFLLVSRPAKRRNLSKLYTIKKLRLPLSEFEILCKTWAPSFKVTLCLRVPAKHMVGGVHREEHRYAKASYQ